MRRCCYTLSPLVSRSPRSFRALHLTVPGDETQNNARKGMWEDQPNWKVRSMFLYWATRGHLTLCDSPPPPLRLLPLFATQTYLAVGVAGVAMSYLRVSLRNMHSESPLLPPQHLARAQLAVALPAALPLILPLHPLSLGHPSQQNYLWPTSKFPIGWAVNNGTYTHRFGKAG